MSWIIAEERLNPEIHSIIDYNIDGNMCICGFVKTGKTITLMHLLRRIKAQAPDSRILFLVFSNLLAKIYQKTFRDFGIRAIIETFWKFRNNDSHYDYIICDDVHLMEASLLNKAKDNGNIVIVSINPFLTLFDESPLAKEKPLSLEQVEEILSPKVFELHYLHFSHLNPIISLSKAMLNRDVTIKLPIFNIKHSHQQAIRICKAMSKDDEYKFVYDNTQKLLSLRYTTAVLFPTNRQILSFVQFLIKMSGKQPWAEKNDQWGRLDFSDLNKYLSSIGLKYQCLGGGFGNIEDIDSKITIMTYFASMGLQFDNVFMPNMNSDLFINYNEEVSKSLFILALTRACYKVYLTYSEMLHPYLSYIKDICSAESTCDNNSDGGHLIL